jgi:peptidoglycan/xylan/chitin deacetylase (PgdA/CDA1 family)
MRPFFIMTVDVDDWSSLLNFYSVKHDKSIANSKASVEDGLIRLLGIFDKHEITATFFVPGEVAQKNGQAIKNIAEDGHEVACHGLVHEKDEFLRERYRQEQQIKEASRIIEEASGEKPVGFRAPCLRANATTLEVLQDHGYIYDSSIAPTFVPGYYGYLSAPLKPYHPSYKSIGKIGACRILEIPVSVNPLVHLPLSAAWMRNLGYSWVRMGIDMNLRLGNPVVFYIHPRDVVSLPREIGAPWHVYRNTGNVAVETLDKIIRHAKKSGAEFIKAADYSKSYAQINSLQ